MPKLDFRQLLATGKPLLGMNCFAGNAAMIEILGYAGFDFVKLDMEHGNNDFNAIAELVRAAECADVTPIARVAENSPVLIMKALDAGATAVIVPHVSTRADLESAVSASLYGPEGGRGACSVVRGNRFGLNRWVDHVASANKSVAIIPLLEDPQAIEAFDDMLAVPQVPAYSIGATDLAQSMGISGADFRHPELAKMAKELSAKAKQAGKVLMTTATPALTPEYAAYLVSIGFGVIGFGVDLRIFAHAVQDISNKFRASVGA